MTFFVDANILVYAAVDGPARATCAAVLAAIARGAADGRTSAAVLEEVWHLELSGRVGAITGLTAASYDIFAPLVSVTDGAFRRALTSPGHGLGANDRLHAATCAEAGIGVILTADRGFDRLAGLRRVDPGDADAVSNLIG